MPTEQDYDALYRGIRDFCATLPECVEGETFGKPNFRAGKKSFIDFGRSSNGRIYLSFKAEPEFGLLLQEDPRIRRARYVGQHGWLVLDLTFEVDWDEVYSLIEGSYRIAALKRMLKALDERQGIG